MDWLIFLEYGLTALSASVNAWYFAAYRAAEGRRRIGAAVMALVSLALLVESLALGAVLYPRSAGGGWAWLTAGALSLLGSLAISLLIFRRRVRER